MISEDCEDSENEQGNDFEDEIVCLS